MRYFSFEIVIEKESEDEGYFAYSPTLPGCFSNGPTIEEAKRSIRARRSTSMCKCSSPKARQSRRPSGLCTSRSSASACRDGSHAAASAKDLVSFLERQGFTEVPQEGSHLTLWHEQQRLAATIPVHSGCDLGRGLAVRILKDAGFTVDDFLRLRWPGLADAQRLIELDRPILTTTLAGEGQASCPRAVGSLGMTQRPTVGSIVGAQETRRTSLSAAVSGTL